jgi:hypothetical protein
LLTGLVVWGVVRDCAVVMLVAVVALWVVVWRLEDEA